ncbi:unnamed protein product [Lymnaea stagnalis]|uniref:TIR domain-containing protein n=1 Tax=Lymnaea stagnalis TaxID=6523 RepID=A0AAV2HWY1_LYMST
MDSAPNAKLNCDLSTDKDYNGTFVDCSRRGLVSIDQSLFPINTTTLVLDDNNITILANDSFSNMTSLRNLRIRSSNVQSIEVNSLRGLTNLDSLNLENNNLPIKKKSFPKTMFRHVPNLRELFIASNTQKMSDHWFDGDRSEMFLELRFPDVIDIFQDLLKLNKLTIDALPVLHLGPEFGNLTHLTSLELYCIAVFVALNDSFIGLSGSAVKELSLLKSSDIFAASLPVAIFQHVTGVESLHFDTYQVGVHNILRALWPFANRTMREIVMNYATFSRYAESPTITFEDGIVRRRLVAPLRDVCVRKVVLANSKLLAIEPGIFLTGAMRHCVKTIDLSANYMSISAWRGVLFETHRLTAIEEFILTGIPAFYRETHTSLLKTKDNADLATRSVEKDNFMEENGEKNDTAGTYSRNKKNTVDALLASKIQRLFWIRFPKKLKSIRLEYITQDCLRTLDFSANILGISGWRGLLFDVHRLRAIEEYTQTGQFSWYKESHTVPLSSSIKHGAKNYMKDQNEIALSFKNPDDLFKNSKRITYTVGDLIATGVQKIFWIRFPKSIKTIRLDLVTLGPYIVSGTTWLVCDVENIQDLYLTNMPHFIKTNQRVLGLESLKFLDASGSGFDVETEFFNDFPNLEVLILSSIFPSNYFETTVSLKRILRDLTKLTYLDISRNNLNAIPPETFSASHNLEHLSLAKNRFSTIPFEVSSLPKLKFLDLSDNAVSFLKDNEMDDMDQQERLLGGFTLKLNGNAILCLCSDIQFLGWLHSTRVSLDNGGNYTCTSEDGVITSTDSFSDVNAIWRRCVGRNVLLISLILAAVMTMGFLCVYLLGRFKTSILAYVLHLVAPQFRTMKRDDYKFGVFVGYADDDYRFVVRHLTRFLEDELGVSTFVHQRDLTAGFTDQLFYEAIQDSWRVLLLITDNFLNHYNVASIVMKYASHSVGPVNQRRVFVLVEESQINNVPSYLHDVLDDSRIVPIYDLVSPLNYEQRQSIRRCVFDSGI